MILKLNDLIVTKDTCDDDIMNIIDHLKLGEYSIIILENTKTKDYIQSICNRFNGIVEIRINSNFAFEHYRAIIPNYKENKTTFINTAFFTMKIENGNLLNTIAIKKLFIDFLHQGDVFSCCQWENITSKMKSKL